MSPVLILGSMPLPGDLISSPSLPNKYSSVECSFNNILRSFSPQVKFFAPVNEHHLFHASNAFYDSGFEESLVVVIDAAGAFFSRKHQKTLECESVYHARYPYFFKKL